MHEQGRCPGICADAYCVTHCALVPHVYSSAVGDWLDAYEWHCVFDRVIKIMRSFEDLQQQYVCGALTCYYVQVLMVLREV